MPSESQNNIINRLKAIADESRTATLEPGEVYVLLAMRDDLVAVSQERDRLSEQLRAAGEPVAHIDDLGHIRFTDGGTLKRGDKLYVAPVPQPQEARDVPQCISQHDHRAMQDDAPISFARGWNNCIAAILADKEKK